MTAPDTINHDTASRLLGLAPGELEALVKSGAVRRADRNAYALPVLVQDYIGHLKVENERFEFSPKQSEIAEHLDMSERSVREFLSSSNLDHKTESLTHLRVAYIRQLREVAAGRGAVGGVDLAAERAMLAREQRFRMEMENAVTRGQLIPVVMLEPKLKAAFVTARTKWMDAVPRLARELPEDSAAREAMLHSEFEAFLHRLADWAQADTIVEDDE